jgi:Ala-tRNA(Pro) deacylase
MDQIAECTEKACYPKGYSQLNRYLQELNIGVMRYRHPPLETCSDADQLGIERSGRRLKNLFLRDNYGKRHFLLITDPNKRVDLKQLSQQESIARLGMASPERLQRYLGVKPGHVSMLALFQDTEQNVELLMDKDVWHSELFQCHPLINRETYVIKKDDLIRFLRHFGHTPKIINVPSISL